MQDITYTSKWFSLYYFALYIFNTKFLNLVADYFLTSVPLFMFFILVPYQILQGRQVLNKFGATQI